MPPGFALDKSGLLWSVPLTIIGLVLLLLAIRRLIRTIQEAVIVKVPLQESSLVAFEESGRVQLHMESPLLSFAFMGVQYEMVEVGSGSGQRLPISRSMGRVRSSGFESARELYGEVFIPQPGRYELRVQGIKNPHEATRCNTVLTRPYTLAMVLCILGIVFSGIALIGGIVSSALFIAGGKPN